MEALKCYVSDRDSDEDDKLATTTTTIKDVETKKATPDDSLKSAQNLKCDFFNLQDSDSDNDSESAQKYRKEDKTVCLDKGEITVPNSYFWEPLGTELNDSHKHSVDDLNKKRLNFNYNYDQENSDCSRRAFKRSKQSNLHYVGNSNLRNPSQIDSSIDTTRYSDANTRNNKNVVADCSNVSNRSLKTDETNCTCDSNNVDLNRKLFDVHGKIKPWIDRQNITYRIPRECERSWKAHDSAVSKIKWNKTQLSHLLMSVSMDTSVKIWNVWSKFESCVRLLRLHSKGIQDGDWSNSGYQILTCSYDKSAAVSDVETGQIIKRYNHKNYVTCGKFHPTNESIFVTGSMDEVIAWDTRQNDEPIKVYTYKDKIGQIQDVIFNRDGSEIFSTGDLISRDSSDRNIMAWDFDNAVVKSNQIYQERFSCTRLKLHPVDNNFLAQSHGNYIALFSASKPYKMCKSLRYEGHKLKGYKVGFDISADGRYVTSGDAGGHIYTFDYKTGHLLRTQHTKLDVNLDVAIHPLLPSTIACGGWNGLIELWH